MAKKPPARVFDALPDPLDFRDRMFEPTLVEVPARIPLAAYRKWKVPILNQGTEGACTGFGLATVANYLLRRRDLKSHRHDVSPRMLYAVARRYDEWPGENYDGSSARGAMKGWHKHGVCAETKWPYDDAAGTLTNTRASDATERPLGWSRITADGVIRWTGREAMLGGHAFAIVAYDARGFWLQNSWGRAWGQQGFALISYDDWLLHASDVWVARLGAPVIVRSPAAAAVGMTSAAQQSRTYVFSDLRPHIISAGNEGRFRTSGTYGTSLEDARDIVERDLPRLTEDWTGRKRVLLYAHGGLVPEESAIQRVADYRGAMLHRQIYPLAFVWKTDYWSTLKNILQDAFSRRRTEGLLDSAKDFMLDRLDDALEPLARALTGKAQWDEMKENAGHASSSDDGAARAVLEMLGPKVASGEYELHIAGHSAGATFMAGVVQLCRDAALPVRTCTLWAPACTTDLFEASYGAALTEGIVDRFALFTLRDDAERDDHCAKIYHKSLLYLVSHAFERRMRIPAIRDGEPLLGMQKHARTAMAPYLRPGIVEMVEAPNGAPAGSEHASRATAHGAFDDDEATVTATIARILRAASAPAGAVAFHRSRAGTADLRQSLAAAQ